MKGTIKRILKDFPFIIINSFVWCILNEKFTIPTVLSGLLFGYVAIYTGRKFIGLSGDSSHTSFNIKKSMIYLVNLIYQIYKAAFRAIRIIITGKTNVNIVHITTTLTNHWHKMILSNSITLTPGTITIEQDENRLTVLCLSVEAEDPDKTGDDIKGSFENILSGR